ncbi:preprotein translocase subunit SecY [Candidatus Bathyarchaeota archaeon]|nr:preprotein translocase subunit SecY [Candidatus Bathyarchaeota archaeon]
MPRFLDLFKPISRIIPEVKPPERKVSFQSRILWTLLALLVYFAMSEITLYGISSSGASDPYANIRIIFASQRGTLMELGIGPIVTAGLIIQLLAGANIISFNRSDPEDRALFTTASKFFSIIMIILQSVLYIIGGAYGEINLVKGVAIFVQLLFAGIIIMLLDELVQKGWGIGSGISLFIVAGITQTIWWSSFNPVTVDDGLRYGGIIAFFESIFKGASIWNWFYRPSGYPDMLGFITTILVFLFVIWVEGMRVELPVSHSTYRGYRGRMPIKLLYVSNIPVILAYALTANITLFSQFIWNRWNVGNTNFFLNMIGMYNQTSSGLSPIGGLVYYTTSPGNLTNVLINPIKAIVYVIIIVGICVIFSITWLEIGGLGAEQMAEQLIDSGMQVPGFRRNKNPIISLLNKYIPTITIIGGLIVGILASVSDFLGVYGSGMGALLAVSIMYQYYQTMVQEQIDDIYPFLRGAFQKS